MDPMSEFFDAGNAGSGQTIEVMDGFDEQRVLETTCAFANSEGGAIYCGATAGKFPPGGPMAFLRYEFNGLRNVAYTHILEQFFDHFISPYPKVIFGITGLDGRFLSFKVEASPQPISLANGRRFKRVGTKNVLVTEALPPSLPVGRSTRPDTKADRPGDPDATRAEKNASIGMSISGHNPRQADEPTSPASGPPASASVRAELASEQPSSESKVIEAAFEAKGTSKAAFVGEAIALDETVNVTVDGGEESAASVAEATSNGREDSLESVRQIGGRTEFREEAAEHEKCLHTNEYANAIANLFSKTEDTEKLCFGLFGHWGRGKTFLIKNVAKLLEVRGYTKIEFSAWKYRTNPETWIYLYESVIKAAKAQNFLLPIRVSFARIGPWPAIFAVWFFWCALQTIGQKIDGYLRCSAFHGQCDSLFLARMFSSNSVGVRYSRDEWRRELL